MTRLLVLALALALAGAAQARGDAAKPFMMALPRLPDL